MDIRSEFEAMDLDKTITGGIRPSASGSLKAGSVLLDHYKVLSLGDYVYSCTYA